MKNYDLSVIIPARNEEFLKRTVEDVLVKKRGNTEVIVILDGAWANPPLIDHPDLTVIYHSQSIGQRASVNEGVKLSKAKFMMKLDAHCILDEGFDVKLMENCKYDWTVIPRMYNLHAFDWQCNECKEKWYQGPTPKKCKKCDNTRKFERIIVWQPRWHKQSDFMRFDSDLHFQYWGALSHRPESQGNIADTMSFIGACWFMHRQKYLDLDGLDEKHGSWGQVGTEISCKTWLSGGRLVVNKNVWFSHLFRTQGGDFGFPYPQSGNQVARSRKYSKELFLEGKWKKAIYPMSWLLKKFWPIPGWENYKFKDGFKPLTKGIIYYTDNALNMKIAHECRKQIAKMGLPIVSVSLKPMNFGKNICLELKRGYEAYFRQILTALQHIDTDIVFFCEHDVLYHFSHFNFTPSKDDTFFYNWNWWRVRSSDGYAVHYDTQLVPGICAYRKLLLEYYRKQVKLIEEHNWDKNYIYKTGFEPGTHNRIPELSGYKTERFDSSYPILDIRHGNNLTRSKWVQDEFRNPKNCKGWVISNIDKIQGWDNLRNIIRI